MDIKDLTLDEAFEFGVRLKCASMGFSKESRDIAVDRVKNAMKTTVAVHNKDAWLAGLGNAGATTASLLALLALGAPLAVGKFGGNVASNIGKSISPVTRVSADSLRMAEEINGLESAVDEMKTRNKRRQAAKLDGSKRSRPLF